MKNIVRKPISIVGIGDHVRINGDWFCVLDRSIVARDDQDNVLMRLKLVSTDERSMRVDYESATIEGIEVLEIDFTGFP